MPDGFYSGTDWQQSSGPYCNRYFQLADLWPEGTNSEVGGGAKDVLAAGLHPILAIGAKANRSCNLTGVVVEYESAQRVLMNVSGCAIVRQYVVNITDYNETDGTAKTWVASYDAGDCVYVDDSDELPAGVTISGASANQSGSGNPKAGYVMYCQDDYDDSGFGGREAHGGGLPVGSMSTTATEYVLACILLTPDSG